MSSTSKFPSLDSVQQLYRSGSTFNNLGSNVLVSGSIFSAKKCTTNTITVYIYLASGSATSLGNSGSIYYVDWSPDGILWIGANATGYTGSVSAMGTWNVIQITGSAPYYRMILRNISGSAISGSVVILGR